MTEIVPTLGRVVWYVISATDAEKINRRRMHARTHLDQHIANSNGVMIHVGNDVSEGQKCAAVVVVAHGDRPDSYVNLKVLLDGSDDYWATSVKVGDQPGSYQWMPYQVGQAAKHAAEVKPAESVGVWLAGCAAPVPATAAIPGPGLSFGGAIEALRLGQRVSRAGWNGKGMWLALQVPDANSKMSLPYIYMKTADNKQVPWLASQTDVLADDWSVA